MTTQTLIHLGRGAALATVTGYLLTRVAVGIDSRFPGDS